MSQEYCENIIEQGLNVSDVRGSIHKTSAIMRQACQRPGDLDEEGNLIYITEQSHKDNCDVNKIIKKYSKTGLINHVSQFEASYGDALSMDFKQANDFVIGAQKKFDELPSNIRKRFKNSAYELLEFMEHPENRPEAIKLGLIRGDWTSETDGLGEHIKDDSERKKVENTVS